jgi:hypothetical protein
MVVCFATKMKSRLIDNIKYTKKFPWSYLAMEELIMSPINSKKSIAVATESPYGHTQINLLRRSVLRQLYGSNVEYDCPLTDIQRYSYGYSKLNTAVNTDLMNSVTNLLGIILKI